MGRHPRIAPAGMVFHVLNRAVNRKRLFESRADYEAFVGVLAAAKARCSLRLLSYCVMPNHWHLVVCPGDDRALSAFGHWLTLTHTHRWRASRGTTGQGPIYQGRFKAFPVESDSHFVTVCRYVERNALTASLVERAED
jgi:REP-associated tyrosine transposase